MRFFADENIPVSTVGFLRSLGHDVVHVLDLDMQGASDKEVYDLIIRDKRHFITKDLDFANILSYKPSENIAILVIRIKDNLPGKINTILATFLRDFKHGFGGKLIILSENKVRIRSNN
jgi:predicted nuclease of predicted toxin-antitoxin system